MKNLNIRFKIIKCLEENIGKDLLSADAADAFQVVAQMEAANSSKSYKQKFLHISRNSQ